MLTLVEQLEADYAVIVTERDALSAQVVALKAEARAAWIVGDAKRSTAIEAEAARLARSLAHRRSVATRIRHQLARATAERSPAPEAVTVATVPSAPPKPGATDRCRRCGGPILLIYGEVSCLMCGTLGHASEFGLVPEQPGHSYR